MAVFPNELVKKIYSLPKTSDAISEFLNSEYEEDLGNGKTVKKLVWMRFEPSYIKVTRHYVNETFDDDADVYMYAHNLLSRCILAEVGPYFESDGQLFSYFQLMVRNTRINNAAKAEKTDFSLIGDLVGPEKDDSDYANFESTVLGSVSPCDEEVAVNSELMDLMDSLETPDLVLFGRLFVQNDCSFDGMYGLCGFDLKRFRDTKREFIKAMRAHYGK